MATYQLPDGRTVSDSMGFTLDGIQYPNNWLLLSTPEDRKERGILGPLPEPPSYDQRFYWGYDADGHLIPKDHTQLVEQWTATTRTTANTLLQPTDWVIIREADNGKLPDPAIKAWREDIRLATGVKVTAIKQTADTDALAAYITSAAYSTWPSDPNTPIPAGPAAGLEFAFNSTSSGF